jgi:hypothetical protein
VALLALLLVGKLTNAQSPSESPSAEPSGEPTLAPTDTTDTPSFFPSETPTQRDDRNPTLDGGDRVADPNDIADLFPYSPKGSTQLSGLTGRWYQMYGSLFLNPAAYCITVDWDVRGGANIWVTMTQRLDSATGTRQSIIGTGTNAAYGIDPIPGILYGVYGSNIQTKSENLNPGIFIVEATGPRNIVTKKYSWVILTDPAKSFSVVFAQNYDDFTANYDTDARDYLASNGFDQLWNKPFKIAQGGDCLYTSRSSI